MAELHSKPSADSLKQQAIDYGLERLESGAAADVQARNIAAHIGVSVGTMYNLFGTLGDYFLALYAALYDELYDIACDRLGKLSRKDLRGRLLALSTAYLDVVSANPAAWNALIAFNRSEIAPEWYREKERALYELIDAEIQSGPKSKHSAQLITKTLWAAMHGIISTSFSRAAPEGPAPVGPASETKEQLEFLIDSVIAKIGAALD